MTGAGTQSWFNGQTRSACGHQPRQRVRQPSAGAGGSCSSGPDTESAAQAWEGGGDRGRFDADTVTVLVHV
jgi:hypothetical protein